MLERIFSLCVSLWKVTFFYLGKRPLLVNDYFLFALPSISVILILNIHTVLCVVVSLCAVRLTNISLINLRYFVSYWLGSFKTHYIFVMSCPEIMQLLWWHLLRQNYDSLVIWASERPSNERLKVLYLNEDSTNT